MMRKKITALFLAVVMVVTLLPTAFAAGNGYSDTQGHWGEDAIDRWSGYGVISGTGSGLFDPDAPLTRAQAAQIFANLLNLSATASVAQYTDVAVGSWYYDAIAKCVAAGILNGTGSNTMSPNTYVSREELFVMFARALGIQPQASAGVTFTDSASTASWAAGYVNALADMGVVGGSGDGTLAPKADIDRASVVALLDKAITAYGNTSGATVGSSSGIVLVVADNVTVMGSVETLVVAGGSAGISGSTVGTISVVGESASVSVGGSANVGQVSVTGANASVTVRGEATVSGVTIADTAQGAELTVSGDATVTAVDSAAQNVTISGDGTIEAATVSGDNTTVDTNGTDLTVSEGTTGVTENDRNVSAGDTVVTEPAEDTGSSGESTTPSRPTNPSRPSYDYYTVTFMLDENTVYDTQRVREGRTVEQPENPTKEGYSFGGWYLDGAVVAYDFTAPVENDITLTARWLANPVTITLMEGQNISTYQTEYGATLNEETLNKVIEAERPYETVTGWWIDSGYDTEYDFTTVVTGDMTLYYRCQGKEYTVTFVIADAQPEAVTDAYGTPVTLPTSTDDAYTWTWYEDEAFTKPVTILSIPGGGLTLYGQWTHIDSELKGHGSATDPFQISNLEQFYAINDLSTAMADGISYYFEQTADITGITNHASSKCVVASFCGEYDGNEYSITAAEGEGTALFLFNQTYGNAVIENLTLVSTSSLGLSVTADPWNVTNLTIANVNAEVLNGATLNLTDQSNFAFLITGAIFNYTEGNQTITIDNCHINASVQNTGTCTGGFIGSGYFPSETIDVSPVVTIRNSSMTGNIIGNTQAGLITGNSAYNSNTTTMLATIEDTTGREAAARNLMRLENVTFNGTITATYADVFSDYGATGDNEFIFNTLYANEINGTWEIGNRTSNPLDNMALELYKTDTGYATNGAEGYTFTLAFNVQAIEISNTVMNGRNVLIPLEIVASGTQVKTGTYIHAYDVDTAIEKGIIENADGLVYSYDCEGGFDVAIVTNVDNTYLIFADLDNTVTVNSSVITEIYGYENGVYVGSVRINQN